ncbi:MAG TPA: amino acid adenylation domain-containing protein [Rugosimonospora sp.]|nr:amino acid adenylation domain-containing protein [Rugosimonospora sp.]
MSDLAARIAKLTPEQRAALTGRLVRQQTGNGDSPARPGVIPVARTAGRVPLSFTQERIWFLEQFNPGTPFHNMSGVTRIGVRMDPVLLGECVDEVARRHEILRTSFGIDRGEPVGLVADAVTVPVQVLPDLPAEQRDRLFAQDARRPFDPRVAPLVRVSLAPGGADESYVQITMHHLVSDGFSTAVVFREIDQLYRMRLAGSRMALPPLPFQFADVAAWERDGAAALDGGVDYWVQRLRDAPQRLELPSERHRPARMTYRGGRLAVDLPPAFVAGIQALARSLGVTPFVVALAGYVVTLSRWSGHEDLVVGVPVANRELPSVGQLIGPFLNTLALRFHVSAGSPFTDISAQVNAAVLTGLEHQGVPFEKVLQAVQASRDPSRSPLVQAAFNFQADQAARAVAPGARLTDLPNGGCQFDLQLSLFSTPTTMSGHLDYYADGYDEDTVAGFVEGYRSVLNAAVSDPGQPVDTLPLVPVNIGTVLADATTRTARPYDVDARVPDLFLAQARRHSDRVALVAGRRVYTYAELAARTAALAARLSHTIEPVPDAHVALCLPRSADMVVAILAVLRAGLAYIPLDPGYPAERLAFICRDSGVRAVLTRTDLRDHLPPVDVPTFHLDDPASEAGLPDELPTPGANRCAYTIYTSGSTGQPKGVRVSHRNVVNFLTSMAQQPGFGDDDVLLSVTSPSFDIAMLEMLLPLAYGGQVVVAADEDVADGQRLAALLDTHRVTVMQATPATWHLLVESGWSGRPGLRALCGGEALPPPLAGALLPRCGELWNMYGPTETTIWSTIHRVTPDDVAAGTVPIGHPIANTVAVPLDRAMRPVPPGVLGELYIGGAGVTLGYHRRPEQTAARFIDGPAGQRLYRTGDLVRTRSDGVLEFGGRDDDQVKVRGFRIELGEIEAVLDTHPGVGRSVATVVGDSASDRRVLAYLQPARGAGPDAAPGDALDLVQVREFLRGRLPEYMVPARILVLEELPRTPNGKLDRAALPAPDQVPQAEQADAAAVDFVAARTEEEERVAAIWRDLLERPAIGVHDGFFSLGGHSLLATKLVFRIREAFGVDLPLHALFTGDPTVAGIAAMVSGQAPAGEGPIDLDLAAEARLPDDLRPDPSAHVHSVHHPQHVLLTGATGFVGAFLLAELLQTTEAVAYCLVRAVSPHQGRDRIRQSLTQYGIWQDGYAGRIIAVPGTLSLGRLGLDRPTWQHLAAMVDVIYHCGAEVNFLRPYHALKTANVTGTVEVLRLACEGAVKPVHFVSTTYVFSRFSYPPGTEFTEDMQPVHDLEYTFGYTQTKWVSEQMVLEAGRRGLPVYVYRAGRVAGHSVTGACQTYDFVWQATKLGIEMAAAPMMDMNVDITPVDYVVGALVRLSRQVRLRNQVFHLVSPQPLPEHDLVAWMEGYGYVGERLGFAQWCERAVQRAADRSDTTAGALAPFFSGILPLDRIPPARFDRRNVDEGLADTPIACPAIDDRLLRTYFDYFTATGYLPSPAALAGREDEG